MVLASWQLAGVCPVKGQDIAPTEKGCTQSAVLGCGGSSVVQSRPQTKPWSEHTSMRSTQEFPMHPYRRPSLQNWGGEGIASQSCSGEAAQTGFPNSFGSSWHVSLSKHAVDWTKPCVVPSPGEPTSPDRPKDSEHVVAALPAHEGNPAADHEYALAS
jgi:hypothetical protein